MRKIIVTIVAVGCAAVAAQAQLSKTDAQAWQDFGLPKKTTAAFQIPVRSATAATKKAPAVAGQSWGTVGDFNRFADEKQMDKGLRKAASQKIKEQEEATRQKQKAEAKKIAPTGAVYGPAGKVIAFGEAVTKKPAAKKAEKPATKTEQQKKDEQFLREMSTWPACQPFK